MKTFEKKDFLQHLGKQLRKLKIENNMTTKEIAYHLNISPQAYGNIERGESDICITRLIDLPAFYKIPVAKLIPKKYRSFKNTNEISGSILN